MRNRYWLSIFKVVVFFLLSYVLVEKYFFILSYQHTGFFFTGKFWIMLLLSLAMMPLNWWLEIKKWQLLLKAEQLSFFTSLQSVLGGLTVGMATPARVGEFAGRIVFLPEDIRISALLKSALGGLIQSVFTLLFPILFFIYFLGKNLPHYPTVYAIISIVLLIAILALILFFPKLEKLGFIQKYNIRHTITHFSLAELAVVFCISGVRYVVYTLQYVVLFHALDSDISLLLIAANCSIMLLLQSISPLAAWLDLPVRSGVAILLFSACFPQKEMIGFIPFVVWCINLLLPSLIGYYFVFNLKNNATKS